MPARSGGLPSMSQGTGPIRSPGGAPRAELDRPENGGGMAPWLLQAMASRGEGAILASESWLVTAWAIVHPDAHVSIVGRRKVKPMIRSRIAKLALAVSLALLMPLESAHCAFMEFGKHSAPTQADAAASHDCCASPGAAASEHASKPDRPDQDPCSSGCTCFQLPAGVPASAIAQIEAPISATTLIVPSSNFVDAPRAITIERVAALDVGSPSLPADPGAHGMRAPPVSA